MSETFFDWYNRNNPNPVPQINEEEIINKAVEASEYSLLGRFESLKSQDAILEGEIRDLDSRIDNNDVSLKTVGGRLGTLESYKENDSQELISLKNRLLTLENQVKDLENNSDGGGDNSGGPIILPLPGPVITNPDPPTAEKKYGAFDFTYVNKWDDLVDLVLNDRNVFVNTRIKVSSNTVLKSSGIIKFGRAGGLDIDGKELKLDVKIENDNNHQIFFNYKYKKNYHHRWNATQGGIWGSFGDDNLRDPRWWGLVVNDNNINKASYEEARLNVDAIEAAALSRNFISGEPIATTVFLPSGRIAICRTIRLDGLKCYLVGRGHAIAGTKLWSNNANWQFDTNHRIKTSHFLAGTTPIVEIGYERQIDKNPDEGFQCGVRNVAIVCPLNTNLPVSGIMWESGLQEGSNISYVSISNYSGYGIGSPNWQHLYHNDPAPKGYYPQMNTVTFDNLWVMSPNNKFRQAIGISLFGLNFQLSNSTVAHQGKGEWQMRPAVILGSRTAGSVNNMHIEHNPPIGVDEASPCILIPNDGGLGRISIDSVYCYLAGNAHERKLSEVVRIEGSRPSIVCSNINHRTGLPQGSRWEALNRTICTVHDKGTGRKGMLQSFNGSGKSLAFYARNYDFNKGKYFTVSTDEDLRL